jgi:hypothetical protein
MHRQGIWNSLLTGSYIGVNAYDSLILKWDLVLCSSITVRRILSVANILAERFFFTQSLIVLAYILSTMSKIHTHGVIQIPMAKRQKAVGEII